MRCLHSVRVMDEMPQRQPEGDLATGLWMGANPHVTLYGWQAKCATVRGCAPGYIFMILAVARPLEIYHGEFDPGSERTLAARLKHASRTARTAMSLEWRTGE